MKKTQYPIVYSCYWNNIDKKIPIAQKKVFDYLGIPLKQVNTNSIPHGTWMTDLCMSAEKHDVIIICDIDAVPLKKSTYEKAISIAKNGGIYGMAQVANHLNPDCIYAGPMFIAFSQKTFSDLGSPDLLHTKELDPAQILTQKAIEFSVPIHLEFPTVVLIPKWPLADKGVFGIGTFYGENEIFHLFQCRNDRHQKIFEAVCDDVLAGKLDFEQYLSITAVKSLRFNEFLWRWMVRLRSKLRWR